MHIPTRDSLAVILLSMLLASCSTQSMQTKAEAPSASPPAPVADSKAASRSLQS